MSEIIKQKFIGSGGNKELDMLTICKNISNDDLIVNAKTVDIFNDYIFINNKVKKTERKLLYSY